MNLSAFEYDLSTEIIKENPTFDDIPILKSFKLSQVAILDLIYPNI